jgi:hypothetical protein
MGNDCVTIRIGLGLGGFKMVKTGYVFINTLFFNTNVPKYIFAISCKNECSLKSL